MNNSKGLIFYTMYATLGIMALSLLGCASNRTLNQQAAQALQQQAPVVLPKRVRRDTPVIHDEYRIGPGDLLEVEVYQFSELRQSETFKLRVAGSGDIHMPLIGNVRAAGLTVPQLEQTLRQRFAKYIRAPEVTVHIAAYQAREIQVMGAVKNPQVYVIKKRNFISLIEALAMAGGVTEEAGRYVNVTRGSHRPAGQVPSAAGSAGTKAGERARQPASPKTTTATSQSISLEPPSVVQQIDLEELLSGSNPALNIDIYPGDAILVPIAGKFYVGGYVYKPGEFMLRSRTTVLQGVAMAGGVKPEASPSYSELINPRRQPPIIPLNLKAIAAGEEEDIVLMAGDYIRIRQTTLMYLANGLWEGLKAFLRFSTIPLGG